MRNYIPIICFIAGWVLGACSVIVGFRLGFRASYEIRNNKDEDPADKGLFKSQKDPAEFELLNEKIDG